METGQGNFDNAFSDKAIRQDFILKVYALLGGLLLINLTAVLIISHVPPVQTFLVNNPLIVIIAAFVFTISLILVFWVRDPDWIPSNQKLSESCF